MPEKFRLAYSVFVTTLTKTLKDEFGGTFSPSLCMDKLQPLLPSIYYSLFALPYCLGVLEKNLIKPNTEHTQDKDRIISRELTVQHL